LKFQTYISLIGAANAITIRQPDAADQYCTHAPPPLSHPPTAPAGGSVVWHSPMGTHTECYWDVTKADGSPATPATPASQPIAHAVSANDFCTQVPNTQAPTCSAGLSPMYHAPIGASTKCFWECTIPFRGPPARTFHMPSKTEDAAIYASQFFMLCGANISDPNSTLTKKDLKKCLKKSIK
jgi:hypothetical protein